MSPWSQLYFHSQERVSKMTNSEWFQNEHFPTGIPHKSNYSYSWDAKKAETEQEQLIYLDQILKLIIYVFINT